MALNRVMRGADLKLYVNGRFFGNVTGISFVITSNHREAMGLDSNIPFELMPTTYTITGNMSLYRLHGDGGLEGQGLMAPSQLIPQEKYVSMTLVDRTTDKLVFRADQCKFLNQSWQAQVKSLVTGSASFKAINFRNEAAY
jgi:hypothetical protein